LKIRSKIFPRNDCIYSYYLLFQDSAIWDSAKWEDTICKRLLEWQSWFHESFSSRPRLRCIKPADGGSIIDDNQIAARWKE